MAGYLDVVPLLIAARPGYESSTHASGAEEDMGECISIGPRVPQLMGT